MFADYGVFEIPSITDRYNYFDKGSTMKIEKKIIRSCNISLIKSDNSIIVTGSYYEAMSPASPESEVMARLSSELIELCLGKIVISILETTKLISIHEYNEKKDALVKQRIESFTSLNRRRKIFDRAVKSVGVTDDIVGKGLDAKISGKGWLVTPMEYIKTDGGYLTYMPNEANICPYDNPDGLSKAIIKMFTICR